MWYQVIINSIGVIWTTLQTIFDKTIYSVFVVLLETR